MNNHNLCNFLLITILVSFLSIPFALTYGQEWVTNGPYGGDISDIAVHPKDENLVFAGTGVGLFKSEDGGANWKETKISSWVGDILFDLSDPQIIYVGSGSGFHKSFDGGKKWFTSGVQNVNDIAIDPSNPKIVYAATEDGLYQSFDGGGFWGKIGFRRAGSVAVHPTNSDIIYMGARPAGEWRPETGHEFHGAIYKSADGGNNWNLVFDPGKEYQGPNFNSHVDSLVIDPKKPETIYAGTRWGDGGIMGLFKSADGGKSWRKIWQPDTAHGPNIHFILLDKENTNKILVGEDGWVSYGLYQSTDGGDTWKPLSQELSMGVHGMAIAPSNPKVIYLATGWGVYKSADGGVTWATMNQGITALGVRYVAVDPGSAGALYAAVSNGIYKSSDGGSTWRLVGLEGGDVIQIVPDPMNKNVFYAACAGGWYTSGTVYKSFDSGDSWWGSGRGFNGGAACIAVALSDPRIIYGGSKHGDAYIYRSSNSGASWDEMRVTEESGRRYWHVHSLAVDAVDPNTVYAYMEGEGVSWGIYKSTDGGKSWKALIIGLCDAWDRPQNIATHPVAPNVVYLAGRCGGIDGVNKSEDGGKTWKIIGIRGQGVQAITLDPNNPNILYAGSDRTVYQSQDGGASWTELGFLDAYIRSITPDPRFSGVVYVATDRGVYIYKASGDVIPPATPREVQVTLQETKAIINWTTNTENDLAGYKVYYGDSPGVYGTPIDVKKETNYTITGLSQNTVYYIAVSAYDTSRNESRLSKEFKLVVGEEPSALSFAMHLFRGINMISLPLKPSIAYTARSFAEKLDTTLVIEYDPTTTEFFSFLPNIATTDGFIIQGGKGYIVNLRADVDVTFTGSAWTSAAPSTIDVEPARVWAFGVGGIVLDKIPPSPLFQRGESAQSNQLVTVQIKNLNTGDTVRSFVGSAGAGRFSAAFVDFSREDVVKISDLIEISLLDASGKLIATHISMVHLENIHDASLIVRLTKDAFIPSQTRLFQNFPNPFNPETWIPYELAEGTNVTISIYDVGGRIIRTLDVGFRPAGVYLDRERAIRWDGRNDSGEKVASGVYLYVMRAGNFRATKRMTVLK